MHYVYILRSKKDGSRYIGTTCNLKNRLREHNAQETISNKAKAPFEMIWCCAFYDKQKAYRFERYLKSSSGYAFTKKRLL